MEHAIIFIGTLFFWFFLGSKANNPHLKQLLYFQSLLFALGIAWLSWYIEANTLLQGLEIYRWIVVILTLSFLFLFGGLWITGAIEKEEIDNGF